MNRSSYKKRGNKYFPHKQNSGSVLNKISFLHDEANDWITYRNQLEKRKEFTGNHIESINAGASNLVSEMESSRFGNYDKMRYSKTLPILKSGSRNHKADSS
jgi:hypothetical protein